MNTHAGRVVWSLVYPTNGHDTWDGELSAVGWLLRLSVQGRQPRTSGGSTSRALQDWTLLQWTSRLWSSIDPTQHSNGDGSTDCC
jgi:hypothetical protein